jgi:hypothetical protein
MHHPQGCLEFSPQMVAAMPLDGARDVRCDVQGSSTEWKGFEKTRKYNVRMLRAVLERRAEKVGAFWFREE